MTFKQFISIILLFCLFSLTVNAKECKNNGTLNAPIQKNGSWDLLKYGPFTIKPVYQFSGQLKLLATNNFLYSYDRTMESMISPIDIVLGWGPASNNDIINQLIFHTRNRWLQILYKDDNYLNLPKLSTIYSHISHSHVIPSSIQIQEQILSTAINKNIYVEGYLVNVEYPDKNWTWNTSNERLDTGIGACEIFYITKWEFCSD